MEEVGRELALGWLCRVVLTKLHCQGVDSIAPDGLEVENEF